MESSQETMQQDQGQQPGADAPGLDALAKLRREAEQESQQQAQESISDEERESQQQQHAAAMAAEEQGYRMGAAAGVGFLETLLKSWQPGIEIPAPQKADLIEKAVPVLKKHGGGMPAWMLPYVEEIQLGMALVGVGFGVAMQVKAIRAAEEEAAAKAAELAAQQQQKSGGGQQHSQGAMPGSEL